MERELLSYYQTLLVEPPTDRSQAIDSILRNIPKDLTKEKNEALMRLITQEEVDQSLKATPLGKAPRPTHKFFLGLLTVQLQKETLPLDLSFPQFSWSPHPP
jgi:hypothetical protein